jgi:dTDP-4-amino-4,6-dideoxygalactose transaminase
MQLVRNHAEAMIDSFDISEKNILGYNYRITDLEAAVANEQFKKLETFNRHKIKLANHFSLLLLDLKGLKGLGQLDYVDNVIFIYPIIFDSNYFNVSREEFVSACNAEGIPMANGYTKPLTDLPLFKNYINNDENYKNANELNNNYLITTKICHHKNVEISDIDDIFMGLKKVYNYYINEPK